jgi:argininosuccinate lyase
MNEPVSSKETPPKSPESPVAGKPWEFAKSDAGSGSDAFAARFVESLSYDRRLFRHDIAGSIAHARMLKNVNLISADDLQQIEAGLKEIEGQIETQGDNWPGWKVELEDVHMCIEAALIEIAGDAGRKLHTGRSRNDQVALDLNLWVNEACGLIGQRFDKISTGLIGLAESDGHIVMPSYTHLQRAQPVVAGGELMAWLSAFSTSKDRFNHLAEHIVHRNPLGSGAIAGSALPLNRQMTSQQLFGNDSISSSSIESTATRDVAVDFVYALAMSSMWLSRWAEQWIIYASTEFGFIKLDARYTTGSSMMPQKQNPDMLELIRGRCGGIYGHLIALLTMCKGLPIGYNRDLQEDKRHLFAAYDTVNDCLEMTARIVASTRFDNDRIELGLGRGFLDATSLAEYLVTQQVPFRTAHQVVGRLVHLCVQEGLDQLSQLSIDQFNAACVEHGQNSDVCDQEVYDWLGPQNVVKRYQTAGNAGVSGFKAQLADWKHRLGASD